jgi:hypothetical protein
MIQKETFVLIFTLYHCYGGAKFFLNSRPMASGLMQLNNGERWVYYKLYRLMGIGRDVDELVRSDIIKSPSATCVLEFRRAVKEACSHLLQDTEVNQLVIYADQLSLNNDRGVVDLLHNATCIFLGILLAQVRGWECRSGPHQFRITRDEKEIF